MQEASIRLKYNEVGNLCAILHEHCSNIVHESLETLCCKSVLYGLTKKLTKKIVDQKESYKIALSVERVVALYWVFSKIDMLDLPPDSYNMYQTVINTTEQFLHNNKLLKDEDDAQTYLIDHQNRIGDA